MDKYKNNFIKIFKKYIIIVIINCITQNSSS